ncbi:hypothetical protein, partial [Psychrobacillus sp. BL-248-WT-3]|uniref:hypothetical protein n=1 Tax=Psychrobacillus sp. BL-248-WT-3 TaxID=2725306 RepID=UPI00197E4DE7
KARRQLHSHRSFYPFDPEGQGAVARHQEKRKRLSLPRQANGKMRGGSCFYIEIDSSKNRRIDF